MTGATRAARSVRTVLLAGTIGALLVVLGAAAWMSYAGGQEEAGIGHVRQAGQGAAREHGGERRD